jgi:predicted transcriptional regulator
MAELHGPEFEELPPIEEEDSETLAKIDAGVRDAAAGRTVGMEEVRRRLPNWITASSSQRER